MDHGHQLLGEYILQKYDPADLFQRTIIEIGSVREDLEGQNSTEYFTKLCMKYNMNLISVDIDKYCSENAVRIFKKYNFKNGLAITQDGEKYIKTLDFFDFIYLDSYDYDHGMHDPKRQVSYQIEFGKDINNKDCHQHHLNMVQSLNSIAEQSKIGDNIICFDDIISTDVGKGVTAIPYLFNNNWILIKSKNRAGLFKLAEIDCDGEFGDYLQKGEL